MENPGARVRRESFLAQYPKSKNYKVKSHKDRDLESKKNNPTDAQSTALGSIREEVENPKLEASPEIGRHLQSQAQNRDLKLNTSIQVDQKKMLKNVQTATGFMKQSSVLPSFFSI